MFMFCSVSGQFRVCNTLFHLNNPQSYCHRGDPNWRLKHTCACLICSNVEICLLVLLYLLRRLTDRVRPKKRKMVRSPCLAALDQARVTNVVSNCCLKTVLKKAKNPTSGFCYFRSASFAPYNRISHLATTRIVHLLVKYSLPPWSN